MVLKISLKIHTLKMVAGPCVENGSWLGNHSRDDGGED